MSERIYAWLLQLYPAGFRSEYGEEARRLIRDRLENERGLIQRFALWCDVVVDLCCSLMHEHSCGEAAGMVSHVATNNDAPLQFYSLNDGAPGRGALLIGAICSVFVLFNFTLLLGPGAKTLPWSRSFYFQRPPVYGLGKQIPRQANPGADATFDSAERKRVIDAISTNLKQHYIDRDVAQKMADLLLAHEKSGDYNSVRSGTEFAELLSNELRTISHNRQLEVIFSERALPPQPGPPSREAQRRYRLLMEQQHYALGSGVFYRMDDHFGISIPEVTLTNP